MPRRRAPRRTAPRTQAPRRAAPQHTLHTGALLATFAALCAGFAMYAFVAPEYAGNFAMFTSRLNRQPVGQLDTVANDRVVSGWAYDPNELNTTVTVVLAVDGVEFARAMTNIVRGANGLPLYGFKDELPEHILDGVPHVVTAQAIDTWSTLPTPLSGSPMRVTLSPPGEDAHGFFGENVQYGWDPGLRTRCASSPNPKDANAYADATACAGTNGLHWTVAVNATKDRSTPCVGTTDHALPINRAGKPLTILWALEKDAESRPRWNVQLTTDLTAPVHPCGAGAFTRYVLQEHIGRGGGTLPAPNVLVQDITIQTASVTTSGATRTIASFTGLWNNRTWVIDLDLAQRRWTDAHAAKDIVRITEKPSETRLEMDAASLGLSLLDGKATPITIPWHAIVDDLIDRELFDAPIGGWEKAATVSLEVGSEVYNVTERAAARQSVRISNWTVRAIEEDTATDASPSASATLGTP